MQFTHRSQSVGIRRFRKAKVRASRGQELAAVDRELGDARTGKHNFGNREAEGIAELERRRAATAVEYAAKHQFGEGRIPRREILVRPYADTTNRIERVLADAVARILRS